MYEIQKGRPLPNDGRDKYRLQSMAVGDSFDFPKEERSLVNAACQYAKNKHGLHFAIRAVDDKTLGCWRVEVSDDQGEKP